MTKGHSQGTMNGKRSQFSIVNDIMNIVNDSFAHKPDGLIVILFTADN